MSATPGAAPRPLDAVDGERAESLRRALSHCFSRFDFYRRRFRASGVTAAAIESEDPAALLAGLPFLEAHELGDLSSESLRTESRIVDLETSSGTTGPRKRRFISHEDDVADHETLAEMWTVCGVEPSDRVACVDTDPVHLMASLARSFELLGAEAHMLCAGPDLHRGLERMSALAPTVLVSVPSILERAADPLCRWYADSPSRPPDRVIYVGETLEDSVRQRLESGLGAEVFAYYGASETSSLGIECPAHDGVHLFTDRNLVEIAADTPGASRGEMVVTTLRQRTLPLLRYRLGDVVEGRGGRCPCGLAFPRIEVMGKAGDVLSVLGCKVGYRPVLEAVYDGCRPGPMQLALSRESSETLTVVLPEEMRPREARIVGSLLGAEPDLDFLVESGYLEVRLRFVDAGYFHAARKRARVVDTRYFVRETSPGAS